MRHFWRQNHMEAMANVGDLDSPRGSRRSHCDSTCMLMRTDAPPADNAAVLKFLSWGALGHGHDQAKALDYVPMPDSVVVQIEQCWPRTSSVRRLALWKMGATDC